MDQMPAMEQISGGNKLMEDFTVDGLHCSKGGHHGKSISMAGSV